jgi:diguanylate cyclase (GGDEF)-like protein/PAS domain S-box-containing protein
MAMGYRKNPASLEELRRLARLRFLGQVPSSATALSIVQAQQLFEELEIHQIELELQNEHLNATRTQLEAALNQSSELFDFSPVGSLMLDADGAISKLNLAAANLLGGERARLLGSRLGLYVAEAERSAFNALLDKASTSLDVQNSELSLHRNGLPVTYVQIRLALLPEDRGWQVILVDITERRQMEDRVRASEERWKLALEAVGDGVWDWNVQTGEVVFSKRFGLLYGFVEQEYGHHVEDWRLRVHPDDRLRVTAELQAYLSGRTGSYANEHRGQCHDGRWKWVLTRGSVVSRTPDGKPLRMIGTHVDITNKKETEEALLMSARFQQAVFDSLSAHIAILDRHGAIIQTNAAWRNYVVENGLVAAPHFVGGNYLEMLGAMCAQDPATVQAVSAGIAAVASGKAVDFQLPQPFYSALDKRWFSLKITPVHDVQERVVVSHEDVTALKAAELASLTLANVDTLTGALSRLNFMNLADQELARAQRYKFPLMVLMLDLDHFKLVNDQHGHAAGDVVLQKFVQTVKSVLRESDLIGRIGGEEFAVLLPNTTLEGGRALAQRIIDSVRDSPVEHNGQRIVYTVSIGAGCLSCETSFAALLSQADAALYRAKNGGRDRLEVGQV